MRELGMALRAAATVFRWCIWILGTALLGILALRRATRVAWGWDAIVGESARCPRGHRNVLVGVWECRSCGSVFEGWAFRPCPVCGESAHYVSCERCGLSIKSPAAP